MFYTSKALMVLKKKKLIFARCTPLQDWADQWLRDQDSIWNV